LLRVSLHELNITAEYPTKEQQVLSLAG